MSDYHLHVWPHRQHPQDPFPTDFPLDRFLQYCQAATDQGVLELGFTEHLYRCREAQPVLGEFWRGGRPELIEHTVRLLQLDVGFSLDEYVEGVLVAKREGLPVKLGLEVDFFPELVEPIRGLLEPYPWDYLLGAVHWVGEWSIDSEEVTGEFSRRGVDQAWEDYFQLVMTLTRSQLVDVLAHVDVCKKYGFRPAREPIHLFHEVASAAAENGVAVEVSSQGLRNPAREVYPSPSFLRIFHEQGVPITLASDAHTPDMTGWGQTEIQAAAQQAGYEQYLHFGHRQPLPQPLVLSVPQHNL